MSEYAQWTYGARMSVSLWAHLVTTIIKNLTRAFEFYNLTTRIPRLIARWSVRLHHSILVFVHLISIDNIKNISWMKLHFEEPVYRPHLVKGILRLWRSFLFFKKKNHNRSPKKNTRRETVFAVKSIKPKIVFYVPEKSLTGNIITRECILQGLRESRFENVKE